MRPRGLSGHVHVHVHVLVALVPLVALVALVALVMLWATPARAQDGATTTGTTTGTTMGATTAENDAVARDRFRRGTELFDAGDYDLAVQEFEAAYDLSHRPELLYNVYLAHERLGNLTQAIGALESYLRDGDPGERRASLESRLARMRERLDREQQETQEREARERELREAAESAGPGPVPWIIAGSGAVVAGAGVVLLLVSAADVSSVENPGPMPSWADVADAYDRAPVLSTIGGIALGVGGAAMLAGLAWGVFTLGSGAGGEDEGEDEDEGEGGATLGVGPGGVMIRGCF